MKNTRKNYYKRYITGFCLVFAVLAVLSPAVLAADEIPKGWIKAGSHPSGYDITIDRSTKRSGKAAARIESNAAVKTDGFGTLMQGIKADAYRGKRIRLSAWMKTENAVSAQIWLRLDGERRSFGFDNMDNRPVKGTTGWTKYDLVLDVPEETLKIAFGFFVSEKGKAWADDIQLEVVGKDIPTTNLMSAEQAKEEFPASTSKREYPIHPVNLDFEI